MLKGKSMFVRSLATLWDWWKVPLKWLVEMKAFGTTTVLMMMEQRKRAVHSLASLLI